MKKTYIISFLLLFAFTYPGFAAERDSLPHREGDKLFSLIQSYYLKNIDSMRYYIKECERIGMVELDSWKKGVGLGLAICKGLTEQMGGSVRVISKVGEGSTFYVIFPQKRSVNS